MKLNSLLKSLYFSLVLFFLMVTVSVKAENALYFPEKVISLESKQWYEGHLSIMKETSLWQAKQDAKKHAYRYLLLSVLADPLSLKVDIKEDKTGILTITEMVRPPKYETSFQRKETSFNLTSVQVGQFLVVLNEPKFWKAKTKGNPIRFGGIQWVIEGVKDQKYHIIERWAPKEKDYPKAVTVLLEMVNY